MHHFDASAFTALSAPKAKAAALAMFGEAMTSPAPDWYGVALALHSVVSRKRGKGAASEDIAMQDDADAGEFVPWADYRVTGKATAIARGRVTVTFADGWTVTVGMLAQRSAKGRKPWSIGHAVRFAVICYKAAAVRRATGDDAALYHVRDGISFPLDALISAPDIVSIESADSSETVAGDLVWSACEANGFTRDARAGAIAVPLALAPVPAGLDRAILEERRALVGRLGLDRSPMHDGARAAAARVVALLYPVPALDVHGYAADCEPEAAPVEIEPEAEEEFASLSEAEEAGPGMFDGWAIVNPAPVLDRAPADHATMLAAGEIVAKPEAFDAFAAWLSPVSHVERFAMVEDALIAWPALAEPCAAIAGEAVEIEAPYAPHIPAAPAKKPRYSFCNVAKAWVPIAG